MLLKVILLASSETSPSRSVYPYTFCTKIVQTTHTEDFLIVSSKIQSTYYIPTTDQMLSKSMKFQRLPDPTLCTLIKDILDENEDKIQEYVNSRDYDGLIRSKLISLLK